MPARNSSRELIGIAQGIQRKNINAVSEHEISLLSIKLVEFDSYVT